jgi:hypothetical protein
MLPIRLSDRQLSAVMRAAAVLSPADRSPFLRAVAHELQGRTIGDGVVHRTIREVQGKFRVPPALDGTADVRPLRRKGAHVESWPATSTR